MKAMRDVRSVGESAQLACEDQIEFDPAVARCYWCSGTEHKVPKLPCHVTLWSFNRRQQDVSHTMFVRYYVMISRPFMELEAEFTAGAEHWIPAMAQRANGHGMKLLSELGFDVGKRRIGKRIEVELGDPRRSIGVTLVPVRWRAATESGLFPSLDGQLEIAKLGLTTTQIGISASYEAPLGWVGKIADRALLHRVAEATVQDFMERVRDQLERAQPC